MHFAVITLFPDMLSAVRDFGVTGRAVASGVIRIDAWNPRNFARDSHRTVDDRPYGGGPGMVMMVAPVCAAIQAARETMEDSVKVIHLSPQGRILNHDGLMELTRQDRLIMIAGRYEGLDERIIEAEVDEEWSIGDYVLSGGELAAMVLIDALTRNLPGVLGDQESARQDSFCNGMLDYPHYTRPEECSGRKVPEVLLSGDHEKIRRWRLKQALGRTWLRRPELLKNLGLDDEQDTLLQEFKAERGKQDYSQ